MRVAGEAGRRRWRWSYLAVLGIGCLVAPRLLEIPSLQAVALRAVEARSGGLVRAERVEVGADLTLRLYGVSLPALSGVRAATAEIWLPGRISAWLAERAGGVASAADDVPWMQIDLSGEGARLSDLAGTLGGFQWTAQAVRARGSLARRGERWRADLTWDVDSLAAHDQSYRSAVDAIFLSGTLRGEFDVAAREGHGEVESLVDRGEVLWNRFYADLANLPVAWSGGVTLRQDRVAVDQVRVRIAGVGELGGGAAYELASGAARAEVELDVDGLGRVYDLGVRQVLGEQHPGIEATRLRGALRGAVALAVDAQGGWKVDGDLHLRDVNASGVEPSFLLTDLELDLPLLIGDPAPAAEQRRGSLRARALQIARIDVAPPAIELLVEPNQIRSQGEVRLPLLGGGAVISGLRADDLASDVPRASFALRLDQLRLEGLAQSLAWPGLSGSLNGELARVEVSPDRLESEGEVVARVFGGVVRARDIGVDQLRSSVPELGVDVDFENLSLARLTDIVTFGRMTGIIHGAVHDLVVVNREPVAFAAWLETVPRDGVSQVISVDAVRQISILGGTSSDPLSQGVLRFFDQYRYAKMGFHCTLHNDLFQLRGVERRGDREYLVVGATLPPRINVISHSQRISFSEMVKRLRQAANVNEPPRMSTKPIENGEEKPATNQHG